jgi:uncharacterized membrane protein
MLKYKLKNNILNNFLFSIKTPNLQYFSAMNKMKTCLAMVLAWCSSIGFSFAQSPSTQVDYLESTGKIYVVVAVIAIIFIGIIALLISLERRVAKMEKHIED